jgi:N-acylneuraminate cytidylyltransferase
LNVVLLTGRGGSKSVTGKNVYPVLGRPLAYYPMLAATRARKVDRIYVSTDSPELKRLAEAMRIGVIDRPPELARDDSELVDAFTHAMSVIGEGIRYLVTMHCNCGVHREGLVDECITLMDQRPEADSCVTGFIEQSVHPYRTKRVDAEGYLHPWLDVPEGTPTNRQALASRCFVLDGAVRVLRVERCFPARGQRPFTYLGRRILHVLNHSGGDVHSLEDISRVERLLRRAGFTEAVPDGARPDRA